VGKDATADIFLGSLAAHLTPREVNNAIQISMLGDNDKPRLEN
jgi:hypothetical protein